MILFTLIGKQAAPGGDVFDLIVLIVAANFGGFLMSLTSLPRLIGMLATGILLQVCFTLNGVLCFTLLDISINLLLLI